MIDGLSLLSFLSFFFCFINIRAHLSGFVVRNLGDGGVPAEIIWSFLLKGCSCWSCFPIFLWKHGYFREGFPGAAFVSL